MTTPFLELIGIGKAYPGVQALSGVSLSISPGEVIGLIGENGAGKSTLMKVLGGIVAPSTGAIKLDGQDRASLSVKDAMAAGIAFVHQELNLFENIDVAGNIFIGREPRIFGPLKLIDRSKIYADARVLLDRVGCDFEPETLVASLSIAQRQQLEIAKALSLGARVVIMDEPTSSLTIAETDRLLSIIQELKRSGVAVIFISHRLGEVQQCVDRVVVLRDGRMVGTLERGSIGHDSMVRMMIGRDLRDLYAAPAAAPGATALELVNFRTSTYPERTVNLAVQRGEILGFAGLIGSGRTELARAVFGIDKPLSGDILLDGQAATIGNPREAIAKGLYLIPEDRKQSGLILDHSIANNISLPNLKAYADLTLINARREARNAEAQRKALKIKTDSVATHAGTLSGGNQQKVVLGKWLSMQPRVLIFDEPTRGVDVGAKMEIYDLMRGLANKGVAILMISSDLEEIIGVSDRVAVMHEGSVTGILKRDQLTQENIMRLAVGQTQH
ncbi:sugar ABC transporter ATP-binding protein [Methylovirgula sp. 4M-Z18]|uniref:sugar ABC transporter ATP-binding protein n=1 Tax=Methylovirgula sp. 4M-Z18 TaxID=2293567 RepID=UPI000E2F3E68|nr:sugar ABC transporter ATP-binding protein [Methylovirgula sp. 4M-Z18]RFB78900.1 sugar ABC transporter ATP-binding protein [Methylovirgula sp. 4M-Z18]